MSEELKMLQDLTAKVEQYKSFLEGKADTKSVEDLQASISEMTKNFNDFKGDEFESKFTEISNKLESVNNLVLETSEKIKELSDGEDVKAKAKKLLTKESIETFTKAIKANKLDPEAKLEAKSVEIFGYANTFETETDTSVFTGRFTDPTLYERNRKTNLILDHFSIPSIGVPELVYMEKVESAVEGDPSTPVDFGGAEWILCGEAKPKRAWRLKSGLAKAKKVAVFTTVEDCLLEDVASMENWIRTDLRDEVLEETNNGLLNNNPSVDEKAPLGLKTEAVQFTGTTPFDETITGATLIDAIVAIASEFSDNKELLQKVFLSSNNFYLIHILKDNEGRYQNNNLVYTNQAGQLFIGGVQVVMVDSEDVPDTHFLAVGANVGWQARSYGNFAIESGLNGENFREDKTSLRAYQRFLTYFPENRRKSVMYDTIQNVVDFINVVEGGGE